MHLCSTLLYVVKRTVDEIHSPEGMLCVWVCVYNYTMYIYILTNFLIIIRGQSLCMHVFLDIEGPPVQDGSFVHVIKACVDEYTLLQRSSWEELLLFCGPSPSFVFHVRVFFWGRHFISGLAFQGERATCVKTTLGTGRNVLRGGMKRGQRGLYTLHFITRILAQSQELLDTASVYQTDPVKLLNITGLLKRNDQ